MAGGSRSRRRKYAEAEEVLRGLVAAGNDLAPDGSLLNPGAVKKLRTAFSDMPGSIWRKALSEIRAQHRGAQPNGASLLTRLHGYQAGAQTNGLNRMTTCRLGTDTKLENGSVQQRSALADDGSMSESSEGERELPRNTFCPIYIMGEWESDEEDKRVSIAILMPTGLCNRSKDHDVRVVNDGRSLELTVVWPRAMTDMAYLHKFWLRKDAGFLHNHPRLISFRAFLRRLRTTSEQPIISTFQLELPFKVKTELTLLKRNTSYLNWTENKEVVLYITLEAPDANYVAENEAIPVFNTI
eukprot:IDg5918t1